MAYYLVKAKVKQHKLADLKERIEQLEIKRMRPFGKALDESLRGAKLTADGCGIWEENDYCSPPLAMERSAVLDHYFFDIRVEEVKQGQGWQQIASLVSMWTLLEVPL